MTAASKEIYRIYEAKLKHTYSYVNRYGKLEKKVHGKLKKHEIKIESMKEYWQDIEEVSKRVKTLYPSCKIIDIQLVRVKYAYSLCEVEILD